MGQYHCRMFDWLMLKSFMLKAIRSLDWSILCAKTKYEICELTVKGPVAVRKYNANVVDFAVKMVEKNATLIIPNDKDEYLSILQ
mmetsp:Transcript_38115/g.38479  ORF Transcript_38115/g.38479 Transcript_38115/m.38479 type:complete len:85 (+) Transcript_38115:941-1195(+)